MPIVEFDLKDTAVCLKCKKGYESKTTWTFCPYCGSKLIDYNKLKVEKI